VEERKKENKKRRKKNKTPYDSTQLGTTTYEGERADRLGFSFSSPLLGLSSFLSLPLSSSLC
jgi:hypothetical protein